jgi:hypothetical protein
MADCLCLIAPVTVCRCLSENERGGKAPNFSAYFTLDMQNIKMVLVGDKVAEKTRVVTTYVRHVTPDTMPPSGSSCRERVYLRVDLHDVVSPGSV